MWVAVYDGKVITVQATPPAADALPAGAEIFEWFGDPPETYQEGYVEPDGTVVPEVPGDDPRPLDYNTNRTEFDDLVGLIEDEITWLDAAIPQIDGMTVGQLQAVLKRVAQENRYMLRAWRYLARKL